MIEPSCRGGCQFEQRGLSYIEALLATLLIAVSLVPATDALRSGIKGASVHESLTVETYLLLGKMEYVLSQSVAVLDDAAAVAGSPTAPTAYSDKVTLPDGAELDRRVYLSRYDGDNADADDDPFTGADEGLLWVRVDIAGTAHALETLTSR